MNYQQADLYVRQLIGSLQEVGQTLATYASEYPLYTFAGTVVVAALVVTTLWPRVADYRR